MRSLAQTLPASTKPLVLAYSNRFDMNKMSMAYEVSNVKSKIEKNMEIFS
jgi:hypothetical protein